MRGEHKVFHLRIGVVFLKEKFFSKEFYFLLKIMNHNFLGLMKMKWKYPIMKFFWNQRSYGLVASVLRASKWSLVLSKEGI